MSSRVKTWWERQGYSPRHAVHSGSSFVEKSVPTPAPEAETREERGYAQRGGPVRLTYVPTRTTDPGRPRTLAAGYDDNSKTMRIDFRGGATYEYYEVTPSEWGRFKRSASPGKFINRVLNAHPYGRVDG